MLRTNTTARLAFQHSPEREQRLLGKILKREEDEQQVQLPSHQPEVPLVQFSERQQFHDAIFNAIGTVTQQDVLREYLPQIESKIGKVDVESMSEQDLNDVLQKTRTSILDDLNREETDRRQLADALKDVDASTATDEQVSKLLREHAGIIEKYFKVSAAITPNQVIDLLQILLHKDIERVRNAGHEKQTGIKWSYLRAEEFETVYRQLRGVKEGETVRTPNAFSHENTMYFNVDHKDFSDPATGTLLANRAVVHEATHLALNHAEGRYGLTSWINVLKGHPRWNDLQTAVEDLFKNDPEYMDTGRKNERIVGEALSIYVANVRHPAQGNAESLKQQQAICTILEGMFQAPHTNFLLILRQQLQETVDRYTEVKDREGKATVSSMLVNAANDSAAQRKLENEVSGKTMKNADGVDTNVDEGIAEAQEHMAEKEGTGIVPTKKLMSSVEKVSSKIDTLESEYPQLKEVVNSKDNTPTEQTELLTAIDQNIEWMSQTRNDLRIIGKYANDLDRWELPQSEGGLSAAEKSVIAENVGFSSNPYKNMTVSMEAADQIVKSDREKLHGIIQQSLAGYEATLENMDKAVAAGNDPSQQAHDEGEGTAWEWLRKNIFSSQGNVVWITPRNIVKIISIYKDAIQQNYISNQTVKENKFARNLNFYKPIQHTLNKLSRNANNTETSEFREYIDREGFTFDEVFGPDGKGKVSGLLHDNRHNFNRAKAVLEYAADHAWLYFLDGLHGHDVYGIDYEEVEGHQSFEELVQKHEAGKTHQIDHGHERVDKYPDVPPIMDTMIHELRHKNIFAVQGIMKRLQDKAKFSHSNTWMLTTLLMLIRDECGKDPTLKYCLDKGMIDNISNHTIQQCAWSVTWLKMLRTPLMKWKESPDNKDFGNNILTKTMEQIEADLLQAGCIFPDTPQGRLDKYEAIAMVLAGKTFSLENGEAQARGLLKYGMRPGVSISIFSTKYKEYRDKYDEFTEQASCNPKDTDPDYFNVRNGGSDIMLLNRTMIGIMLEKTSTGTWTHKTQAEGFMAQVFERHAELGKKDPEAQKHLEEELRAKISSWWNNTDDSRKNQFHANRDQSGNLMWEEFLKRNLLDVQARANLQKTIKKNYIDSLPSGTPDKDRAKAAEELRVKKLFDEADRAG